MKKITSFSYLFLVVIFTIIGYITSNDYFFVLSIFVCIVYLLIQYNTELQRKLEIIEKDIDSLKGLQAIMLDSIQGFIENADLIKNDSKKLDISTSILAHIHISNIASLIEKLSSMERYEEASVIKKQMDEFIEIISKIVPNVKLIKINNIDDIMRSVNTDD